MSDENTINAWNSFHRFPEERISLANYHPELFVKIQIPWPPPLRQPHVGQHRGKWVVRYWVEWDGGFWECWVHRDTFYEACQDFGNGFWR